MNHEPLPTTTAFIHNHPITVLFDTGSQINIISPTLASQLHLNIIKLQQPWPISFANRTQSQLTYAVNNIPLTFKGFAYHKIPTTLSYSPGALILNSSFDLILGIPFIRHWRFQQHFCNNSIYTLKSLGIPHTIPLSTTNTKSCHNPMPIFTSNFTPIPGTTETTNYH